MTIFVTYDTNQYKYFKENGFLSLIHGLHPKTKNMFWVYERTDEFNECARNWSNKNKGNEKNKEINL